MTKVSLSDLDKAFGYKDPNDAKAGLFGVLTELQGIKLSVVSGVEAAANMTVSGITTDDTLISVIEVRANTSALPIDRTKSSQITANNTITCNEAANATSHMYILWFNKS